MVKSLQLLVSFAHDAFKRRVVIWSPLATFPDVHVEMIWLQIVWKTMKGGVFDMTGIAEELTADNFARLSGLVEMSKTRRLGTAQTRYLLFRSYVQKPVLEV